MMYLYSKFPARHFWTLLSLAGSLAILVSIGVYFDGSRTPTFLIEKGTIASDPIWRAAFLLHIVSSSVCLACGPVLMVLRWARLKRFHATVGYVYLNAVLWIAAPTGLVISPASKAGSIAAWGFFVTGVLWWASTWMSYRSIKPSDSSNQSNVGAHIRWAIRSYSLALSAVWFRAVQILIANLDPKISSDTNYVASVWISLLIGIAISETSILSLPLPTSRRSLDVEASNHSPSVFSKS